VSILSGTSVIGWLSGHDSELKLVRSGKNTRDSPTDLVQNGLLSIGRKYQTTNHFG